MSVDRYGACPQLGLPLLFAWVIANIVACFIFCVFKCGGGS